MTQTDDPVLHYSSAAPANPERHGAGAVLTLGFGTTVAMWAVGYFGRLPGDVLPAPALLGLMLICLFVGGLVAGRSAAWGIRRAALAGVVVGLLNLLILGSLLIDPESKRIVPTAVLFVPLSIVATAGIMAFGAAIGRAMAPATPRRHWLGHFSSVTIAATILLISIGGAVTGSQAGLAVPDWPNSYGFNMFLYPLSRMTGGIYFEHSHRLMGALVGLTTITFAVYAWLRTRRPIVRGLAIAATILVIGQGILGGLRVTGKLTTSMNPSELAPSIQLAVVHGVLAQLFLSTLVVLRCFVSEAFTATPRGTPHVSAKLDRPLVVFLVLGLVTQLSLGAILRHTHAVWALHSHIAIAVLVLCVGGVAALRTAFLYDRQPQIAALGKVVLVLIGVQFLVGWVAFAVTGGSTSPGEPTLADVIVTTIHQTLGAILLASTVGLATWHLRLVRPLPRGAQASDYAAADVPSGARHA